MAENLIFMLFLKTRANLQLIVRNLNVVASLWPFEVVRFENKSILKFV